MAIGGSDVVKLFRLVLVVLLQRIQPFFLHPVGGNLVQDLHLIERCDQVVTRRALNLQRDVGVVLDIFGEPDSREVAPSQLLDNQVPLDEHFTDVHRVVSAELVIRHALVLR